MTINEIEARLWQAIHRQMSVQVVLFWGLFLGTERERAVVESTNKATYEQILGNFLNRKVGKKCIDLSFDSS